jgi:hypothetical protein
MLTNELRQAQIRVDADAWLGALTHNWNYIGYDEINYTYVPEGQELLAKLMEFQEQPFPTGLARRSAASRQTSGPRMCRSSMGSITSTMPARALAKIRR